MVNGLALCAGIGGLELGLRLAMPNYRTVVYVERESYAAATLVARMEDAAMDSAPIWDDLTTFDGAAWRGCVDIVTAGFPCQPWSFAGSRAGTDDERWIWPAIARIIRDVEPGAVFLENVPGLVSGGLEHVLWSLASLWFDAEWCVLGASDLGASHQRKRLFILAHARGKRSERWRDGRDMGSEARARYWQTPSVSDTTGGHATRSGSRSAELLLPGQGKVIGHQLPTTCTHGGECRRVLNPRFVDWLMGFPTGWSDYAQTVTGWSQWLQRWRTYISEIGW